MNHAPSSLIRTGVTRSRGLALRSGLLAAGAALAVILGGLGVAGAEPTGGGDERSSTTISAARSDERSPMRTRHGRRHRRMLAALSAAARALGTSEAELRRALTGGQSIAQVAAARDVPVQRVVDALVAAARARLDSQVSEGRLTREMADRRAAALNRRATALVERKGLRSSSFAGRRHHRPGMALTTAARTIGISEAELRDALAGGQSVAQVAQARGVAVERVVDALVAQARTHLDAAVRAGRLTQAEADRKGRTLRARLSDLVNRAGPRRVGPEPDAEGSPRR